MQMRARTIQAILAAGFAATALGACDNRKEAATPVTPPPAEAAIVPGGAAVTVPARTGSMSSGTLGSSTVVGASKPGEAGIAIAH